MRSLCLSTLLLLNAADLERIGIRAARALIGQAGLRRYDAKGLTHFMKVGNLRIVPIACGLLAFMGWTKIGFAFSKAFQLY